MQVTLKKPHTHAGQAMKPGDTLDLDAGTAAWLAGLGVIDPLPAEAGAVNVKTTKKGA